MPFRSDCSSSLCGSRDAAGAGTGQLEAPGQPAAKKRRPAPKSTPDSSLLLSLPEDLLLCILAKASRDCHCIADVINIASVSRSLRTLVHSPEVLLSLPAPVVSLPLSLWSRASTRILALSSLAGNPHACYHLGMIRFYCYGDAASGLALLTRAAAAQHVEALYSLAVIEFNGSARSRLHRNPRGGLILCGRAVSLGHCDALFELGHCVMDGLGTAPNKPEGRRLLAEAKAWQVGQASGHMAPPSGPRHATGTPCGGPPQPHCAYHVPPPQTQHGEAMKVALPAPTSVHGTSLSPRNPPDDPAASFLQGRLAVVQGCCTSSPPDDIRRTSLETTCASQRPLAPHGSATEREPRISHGAQRSGAPFAQSCSRVGLSLPRDVSAQDLQAGPGNLCACASAAPLQADTYQRPGFAVLVSLREPGPNNPLSEVEPPSPTSAVTLTVPSEGVPQEQRRQGCKQAECCSRDALRGPTFLGPRGPGGIQGQHAHLGDEHRAEQHSGEAWEHQPESTAEGQDKAGPATPAHKFLVDWWATCLRLEQGLQLQAEARWLRGAGVPQEGVGGRCVQGGAGARLGPGEGTAAAAPSWSAQLEQRCMCSNSLCGRREMRPREFRCCASCREAKYCSRVCQAKDWKKGHKLACTLLTDFLQQQQQQQLMLLQHQHEQGQPQEPLRSQLDV